MISNYDFMNKCIDESIYWTDDLEPLKENDIVYAIGNFEGREFFFQQAIVKKVRGTNTVGLEFDGNINGHNLDGLCAHGCGLWVNLDAHYFILCSRNMEKFYTRTRLKGD